MAEASRRSALAAATARLTWTGGLRSAATGFAGVVLGLALAERGFDAAALGLVVGAGLAGSAAGTALVAFQAHRSGHRALLLAFGALAAAGYAAVAVVASPAVLALAAFVTGLNGFGRDRGPAQTLELSLLAEAAGADARTRVYSRYTMAQDVAGALGALAAGLPVALGAAADLSADAAYRAAFAVLAALSLAVLGLYAGVPELRAARAGAPPLDPMTRRRLGSLGVLTALDSVGGGFLAGTILSYWFFRRFGLSPEALGVMFFAARGLNAASYVAAERLARRIGLVRTMVFTHLPSSVFLLVLPFVPSAWAAVALFLAREALVQMDVPTRQSYIAAVVPPAHRTFALGAMGVVRSAGWAAGAPLAGLAMGALGMAAPLLGGAGLKIAYDLALFAAFRDVRPPEEAARR